MNIGERERGEMKEKLARSYLLKLGDGYLSALYTTLLLYFLKTSIMKFFLKVI